jgi:ferredoxin
MKRQIIKIDEDLCNGCGMCVPNCMEGALQIIDNKARLVSDLFCDGLGACIGHCPEGAITIEEREAEPYDEIRVMESISKQGDNTIKAHLNHLREHGEMGFYVQALQYLEQNNIKINLEETKMDNELTMEQHHGSACGCPGSQTMDFREDIATATPAFAPAAEMKSELRQWPVQMHLINPQASYFQEADVVLAADCVAFSMGNFHQKFLKGKSLAIACPKLDSNTEVYIEKLVSMIDQAKINTLSVMMMEVPCCGGLMQMVNMARSKAQRKIPVKEVYVGVKGDIIQEEWA